MKRTETTGNAPADAYLQELRTRAKDLAPPERAELVESITEHVRVGVRQADGDNEAIEAMLAARGDRPPAWQPPG